MAKDPFAAGSAASASATAAAGPTKSREIRVGLVMYGGVSLAVYINGVSREFFNAVRGRGVYRLLKAFTDSDVVVDVISGTSAGGINGILLGYALCNDREFGACADLWREHGDIARLLRDPARAGEETLSLLNSETYYQPKLANAFANMTPCRLREDEDVSRTEELDLFVTGTETEGRRYTVLDDAGHAVDVKDHRAVFQLKHREGRKRPFDPAFNVKGRPSAVQDAVTHGALAKLGRITSCFPVAFAPVRVECVPKGQVSPDTTIEGQADALLTEWGSLHRDSCFLDGGVLDNKPFTYTVREIFRRTAEREVKRLLFYVEPDPEQFDEVRAVRQPNVVQAAMLALVGIPGYESIADDLKLLSERNSKIRTYKRLSEHLESESRAMGLVPPSAAESTIYWRTRLVALSQRVVRGLLRVEGEDQLLDPELRRRAEELFREFDGYAEEAGIAEDLLGNFDIYYRLRRLFDLIDFCYLEGRKDPRWSELLRVLNRQIMLLDIVRHGMEQLLDEMSFNWRHMQAAEVWQIVARAFSRLLAVVGKEGPVPEGYASSLDDKKVRDLLGQVNRRLRARIDDIKKELGQGGLEPPPATATNLLRDADDYEIATIKSFPIDSAMWEGDKPLDRYQRFESLDARLYPLEMFAGVSEKDEIRTVRISPIDAQRGFSRRDSASKTAGQTLFHFGGFFKRSWRSNDILCGRLDAVAQILEEFFVAERLKAVAANPALAASLQARLGSDLDPAKLFPNAGANAQRDLRDWLTEMMSGSPLAYERQRFDLNLTLLVEAAQLEILHEDLSKLIADEELERREWDEPNEQRLTPLSAVATAERTALQLLDETAPRSGAPPAGPRQTAFGRFFGGYGSTTAGQTVFAAVPPMVLLETLAKGLLVTRDALMTAFGKRASDVRKSVAYKWIDRVLRLFYGSVIFFRRAPPQAMAVMIGIAAASGLALVVGIIWWDEIIAPKGKPFQLRWFSLFLVAPLVILAGQSCLLLGVTRLRRAASLVGVVIAGIVTVVVVWKWGSISEFFAGALEGIAGWLREG